MVDDKILFSNCSKTITAMFADALRKPRIERDELQGWTIKVDELGKIRKRQKPGNRKYRFSRDMKLVDDEIAYTLGHRCLNLEPDNRATTALLKRRFEEPDEILGLLLDFEVRIPNNPEDTKPFHRITGKQPLDKKTDDLLEKNKTRHRSTRNIRESDKTIHRIWQPDQGVQSPPVRYPHQQEGERKPEIGDKWKWMRRINRKRRQDWKYMVQKVTFQPRFVVLSEIAAFYDRNACLRQKKL